jgi:hypothetical protein
MSAKEKLKDSAPLLTVDLGSLLLEINRKVSLNKIYLRSILKRQLEVKELLNKTPELEIDSLVQTKLKKLTFKIKEFSDKTNSEDLEIFLK